MLANSTASAMTFWEELNLKEKIRNLPFPLQLILSGALVVLLLIDLVIPDIVPLIDELVLMFLLYTTTSASMGTLQDRKRDKLGAERKALDVRDQQIQPEDRTAEGQPGVEDELFAAAQKELEALEGSPF